MRLPIVLLSLSMAFVAPLAVAADTDQVKAEFSKTFASGSAADKKAALRTAQALGKDHDDTAFELLIKAVNDRQVHDEAVMALRARTGLQPTLLNRGSGYPGYPASDDASEWNNWLAARKKDKETQKKIAEGEKKIKDLEEAEKKKATEGEDGDKPSDATASGDKPTDGTEGKPGGKTPGKPAYEPPSDLGPLVRINFKNGGSLLCYILSRRVNPDGELQSVRVVHQNNGGEETLMADLIARIEENL